MKNKLIKNIDQKPSGSLSSPPDSSLEIPRKKHGKNASCLSKFTSGKKEQVFFTDKDRENSDRLFCQNHITSGDFHFASKVVDTEN